MGRASETRKQWDEAAAHKNLGVARFVGRFPNRKTNSRKPRNSNRLRSIHFNLGNALLRQNKLQARHPILCAVRLQPVNLQAQTTLPLSSTGLANQPAQVAAANAYLSYILISAVFVSHKRTYFPTEFRLP